jgi:hypothetical protein
LEWRETMTVFNPRICVPILLVAMFAVAACSNDNAAIEPDEAAESQALGTTKCGATGDFNDSQKCLDRTLDSDFFRSDPRALQVLESGDAYSMEEFDELSNPPIGQNPRPGNTNTFAFKVLNALIWVGYSFEAEGGVPSSVQPHRKGSRMEW